MRRLLIALGTMLWGTLVFSLGLRVHFPGEQAIERARWELAQATSGAWDFTAESVSPWALSGLALEDVVIYRAPPKKRGRRARKNPAVGQPSPVLRLDTLRARVAPLSLLAREPEISGSADVYGGELNAEVALGSEERRVKIDAVGIDLSAMPIEGDGWRLDLAGLATLAIDLALDMTDIAQTTGSAALSFQGLELKGGEAGGIELLATSFSEAVLEVEVEDGAARIEEGSFKSDLVEAELSGEATLNGSDVARWRLKVDISLKFDDTLERFVKIDPMMRKARDDQGVFHLVCSGTVSRPRCREDRSQVRGRSGRRDRVGPPGMARGADSARDDEESTESGDERRSRRMDRIRDRRDRLRKTRPEGDLPDEGLRPGVDELDPIGPRSRRGLPRGPGEFDQMIPPDDALIDEIEGEDNFIEDDLIDQDGVPYQGDELGDEPIYDEQQFEDE